MDRQFDKLSISASGLLGDRHSQPHHYQTQPQHYQQQQQQQQQLPHHPIRQSQQPTTVYGANRRDYARENGGAAEQHEQSPAGESVRQRTGRIRQSRSSTWGGGDGANGQLPSAATSAAIASAELDETVDLLRRAPSQAESPRTPRTPGGGSPRYAAGPDDQHHLAAISPRGAAGTTSVPHSYHRRDRHPSSSSGGGGLMVTEDDFRHAREGNNHSTVQADGSGGWQQSVRGPGDVSSRLLQKYKTDSLRVEVTEADRRQQHPAAGLSKSHEGFIVPRRLPPIGAASSSAADRGNDDNDDDDDDDDIECDGGGEDEEDIEEADANHHRHQRRHNQRKHQHKMHQEQSAHKGRTRTN